MKLRKIISGGQTGADQAGLRAARQLGLETGGWAPKGWRTEDGPAPWLADFGLAEHSSPLYPPRTHANAADADCTIWFGSITSPGYQCTVAGCAKVNKPCFVMSDDLESAQTQLRSYADRFGIINVAGNRASKNPNLAQFVMETFEVLCLD